MKEQQHHGELGEVLHGLLVRARVHRSHHVRRDSTLWIGTFALFNGGLSTALMALGALVTGEPLVFPSLGPTAFMLFYQPTSPVASPRNAVCGHAIGLLAGYSALSLFGLTHGPAALAGGVTWAWVGSASVSLALTAGLMIWLRVPHPPAGATTLIVSLGIVPHPIQLVALFGAIVLLVVQGFVINRLAGVPYPWWSPSPNRPEPPADRAAGSQAGSP